MHTNHPPNTLPLVFKTFIVRSNILVCVWSGEPSASSAQISRSISCVSPFSFLQTSCIGPCSIPSKHCSFHPRISTVHNVLLWFLPSSGKLITIYPWDLSSDITFSKIACQEILRNSRHQFSSVDQSCLTLCDSMEYNMPGLPVHHQLPEFTQTHVHWVSDAIQPSHPLLFPSPAFNISQYKDLFKWVSSSHQVAQVLEFQL